ncbi:MAG: hypothetical protein IJ877_01385 [Candidatus Gastranaerophilales bacterium]|nr:hypothetical protein [Candidatus Gastranaerophilales bacterium]
MKRRELIQAGLLATGAVAFAACNKTQVSNDEFTITPKQTAQYEFSTPMPFNHKSIDDLSEINSKIKKSQITTVYNNTPLPLGSRFNQWIQVNRGENYNIKSYEDFAQYVKYSIGNGFKFVYLMNSPKPFSENDFNTFKDEFKYLLDFLYQIGVRDIKVGNTQVATLINDITQNSFNLSASTAFEYHNNSQYSYLFKNYPNFDLIDVSNDENHNFKFLKALANAFPDKKLELMVNECCIKGCPARISHISELNFCAFNCQKIKDEYGLLHFFIKTGAIYPWNLEYYSSIGINNFKFSALAAMGSRANPIDMSYLKKYLEITEHGTDIATVNDFFNKIFTFPITNRDDIKLTELKSYLPDIKHFIKYGDKCALRCNSECNYCELCAKRTQNFLDT